VKQQCEGYTNVRDFFNYSVDSSSPCSLNGPTSPPLSSFVDCSLVTDKVFKGIYDGVQTTKLDTLAAETASFLSTVHPDYEKLAARIAISNLHKETSSSFVEVVNNLFTYQNPRNNKHSPMVSEELHDIVNKNAELIESVIDYRRDLNYSYLGFKTLCRSYLMRINGHIVERPQHMLMRVSIGIHKHDLQSAFETYRLMSDFYMTHATPTLFNSGKLIPSACLYLERENVLTR